MERLSAGIILVQVLLLVSAGVARADKPEPARPAQPSSSLGGVLQDLASRADVVFVGQVEDIERAAGSGIVTVNFSVQQVVLGQVGGAYSLREWAGLWAAGQQRYRVGERAMVFLHAPGAAGLSSPVDGLDGVVPLIPMGEDAEPMLDVRWLQTKVQRAVGAALPASSQGAVLLHEAVATVTASRDPRPEPVLVPVAEPVLRPIPVGVLPEPFPTRTVVLSRGAVEVQGDGHDIR
jgi:hypothetical protein